MKTFFAILALVGFTYALPAKNVRDLGDDLNDLLALLPVDQMLSVAENYLLTDAEVQADFTYLQSDEVKAVINEINEQPEVKDLYSFISEHGYEEIYDTLNTVNDLLGWDHVEPAAKMVGKLPSHRTFQQLLDDEVALIPLDQVQALFQDKLANSPDFKALYDKVTGDDFHTFVDKIFNQDDVQAVLSHLEELKVDVNSIVALLKDFLGWQ